MSEMIVFEYQGSEVVFDASARMWNLNAMHRAAGGAPHKAPAQWLRNQQVQELIAVLAEEERNCANSHSFVERREGRNGGTWAHWQIAAAYAHYLNPRFYLQWNEWALERQQQIRNETAPARTNKAAERDIDRQLSEIRAGMKAMWKRLDALESEQQKRKTNLLADTRMLSTFEAINAALDTYFVIGPMIDRRMTSNEIFDVIADVGVSLPGSTHGIYIALGRALSNKGVIRKTGTHSRFYTGIRPRVEQEVI